MRSLRFLLSRRWLLLALAVVVLSYLAYWLGQWQFHRLADRKERNAITVGNESATPLPMADVLTPGRPVAASDEWRLVTATGTYRADQTILVRYQTRNGKLGVDVVVPLVTDQGTVLIDRGWMASDTAIPPLSSLPDAPTGEVTVEGWARADADGDSTAVDDGSTRAISSVTIGKAIGVTLAGGFVDLKSEDPAPDQPLERTELPDLGNGPHFFYGLQWWFFGLLAVGGFFYLAYDEWRRRDQPAPAQVADGVTKSAAGRRRPEA